MDDHLSIGVIGHVDHGKTTLVKALTGIETDRLAEERERGLTIVLGFAHLKTSTGQIDLIDAPGHADFVRAMISGATGIDAALVCIDAGEGFMPQTREHLRIISLLGITRAVIALTKTDLVAMDELAARQQVVRDDLASMGFDDVTIVPVCAPKGEGLDSLVAALDALFADRTQRADSEKFYLPFDRIFTKPGFGTVVTGTLRAGSLAVGDDAEIPDLGLAVKVRRLEVHGAEAARAMPGQRVAVNLRVDGGAKLVRGQSLASPDWLAPSEWWTATLRLADDVEMSLKNGKPVRLLYGTREVIVTLRLLDRDILHPGESAIVQFKLNPAEAAWDQDHFVVRTISPVETVGGGRFLNTRAARVQRFDQDAIAQLAAVDGADQHDAVLAIAEQAGAAGISVATIAEQLQASVEDVQRVLAEGGAFMSADGHVLAPGQAGTLSMKAIQLVQDHHAQFPSRTGMARLELIEKLGLTKSVGDLLVAGLCASGDMGITGDRISIHGFDPLGALGDAERERIQQLEATIRETPLMPPTLDEVGTVDKRNATRVELLIEIGRLVPLHDFKRKNLFLFHAEDIEQAVISLRAAWPPPAQFRLGEAREHLGVTRKFLQPVLEYLDKQKITQRREDVRKFLA